MFLSFKVLFKNPAGLVASCIWSEFEIWLFSSWVSDFIIQVILDLAGVSNLKTGSLTSKTESQPEEECVNGTKLPRVHWVCTECWVADCSLVHGHGLPDGWVESSNFFELLIIALYSCSQRSSFIHSININCDPLMYQTLLWVLDACVLSCFSHVWLFATLWL